MIVIGFVVIAALMYKMLVYRELPKENAPKKKWTQIAGGLFIDLIGITAFALLLTNIEGIF
jgi:hypothetical protein